MSDTNTRTLTKEDIITAIVGSIPNQRSYDELQKLQVGSPTGEWTGDWEWSKVTLATKTEEELETIYNLTKRSWYPPYTT